MRSLALGLLVALAGCIGAPATLDMPAAPASVLIIGAIGNSLMLGYNADSDHIEAAPEVSWATGKEAWSFSSQAGARGVENVARPGAGSDEFLDQAADLDQATFVLVLLHDEAMCGPSSVGPATEPSAFESQLREGTRALLERGIVPMLVTPPDIVALTAAARAKPPANDFVLNYAFGQECGLQPGLAERQASMNAAIARVAEQEGALHDHGAVFQIRWSPEMVSDVDGFHPSLLGLEAIANAAWDAYGAS